jgi:hypothetical protein
MPKWITIFAFAGGFLLAAALGVALFAHALFGAFLGMIG